MDALLMKLGSNETKILDVGVNVGQTLMKWKSLFPKAYYLGVEPNINCAHYVNDLIQKNELQNATVLPVALSNEPKINFLYTNSLDPSDIAASTIENFREKGNNKSNSIASLSFKEISSIETFDLIKIDVEGAESDIIKSIFSLPLLNKPVIICEILPVYSASNVDRLKRQELIQEILTDNNYLIFRIKKSNKLTLDQLEKIDVHSNMENCEYLFIHHDNAEKIKSNFN